MVKTVILAATLAWAVFAAAPAHAVAVVGATDVRITNALGIYLQVAEVVASQLGTGKDVTLAANGGMATANNQYSAISGPGNAIDGNTGGNYFADHIYHSLDSSGILNLTFAPTTLGSLTIYGRTDCCTYRDLYNVSIYNAAGTTLYSGQLDATTTNPATIAFSAAVPEPGTVALMLGGLGLAAFGLRRPAA